MCTPFGRGRRGDLDAPWTDGQLREFASYIVNPAAGDKSGMAKAVLDYFGEDALPLNPYVFGITTGGSPPHENITHTQFKIYIYDVAQQITAGENWLEVHIGGGGPGQYLTPWETARDAFAHEWQHVCHHTWNRAEWGVPREFASFNEMCSMLSVAMFGKETLDSSSLPYDNSLSHSGTGSFAQACMNAISEYPGGGQVGGCESMYGRPYNDWAMFAIYLNNVYGVDADPPGSPTGDLVYRWIRNHIEEGGGITYQHDFEGLGAVLDHDDLDAFFSSSSASPHQRVKEVFRSYALAKFLNLQSPQPGQTQYQWLAQGVDPDGFRPQELYKFLRDANGYCFDNIHTSPIYHLPESTRTEVSGWQESITYWPHDPPPPTCEESYGGALYEWQKRRMVKLETYGTNYIVLRPPASGPTDLSFSLRFLPGSSCMKCPDEVGDAYRLVGLDQDYEGKVELAVDFISYDWESAPPLLEPGGTSGLDYYGGNMRVIESHWVTPQANEVVDFDLNSFTAGDDAVAVVLSLVPTESVAEDIPITVLPYEYRFQTLPASVNYLSSPITSAVVLQAEQSYWINGNLVIQVGGSLTIHPGVQVYFCDEEAKITVNGGTLSIAGTAASPVEFLPSNLPGDTNTTYAGLSALGGGLIEAEHWIVNGALQLTASSATVRIANSALYMPDDDDNAIVLDVENAANNPVFEDCLITRVNRIRLDSAETGAVAEVTGSTFVQRGTFQSPLSMPPPLLSTIKGELRISESYLYFLGTGAQIGEKYMPHVPEAEIGPGVVINPLESATAPECGLKARGNAIVSVHDSKIERTLGSSAIWIATGVKVWDAAHVDLWGNDIHGCNYGLINYAKNGLVDLQPGPGQEPNFIAPYVRDADCWQRPPGGDCERDYSQVDMVRVYNTIRLPAPPIAAAGNLWGTCEAAGEPWDLDCMCASAFFPPDATRVSYVPWEPAVGEHAMIACANSPGSGEFFLGSQAPSPEPEGAWPNPFNGTICFRFRAGGAAGVLEVFDILGRRVTDLKGRLNANGDQEFVWEGRNAEGAPVSSGVYLYRLTEPRRTTQGKVVYVK